MERLSESSEGRRARENTATKSTFCSGKVTGNICGDTLEKLKEKEDKVGESQSEVNFPCERRSLGESNKGIAELSEMVAEEICSDALLDTNAVPGQPDGSAEFGTLCSECMESSEIKSHLSKEGAEDVPGKSINSKKELCVEGGNMNQTDKYVAELEQKLASLQEQLSKVNHIKGLISFLLIKYLQFNNWLFYMLSCSFSDAIIFSMTSQCTAINLYPKQNFV